MLFFILVSLIALVSAQCWRDIPCSGPKEATFTGPWDANIYAPSSRTASPKSILHWPSTNASASWPYLKATTYPGGVHLSGNGSLVTYDFGVEVGGIASVSYSGSGNGTLGIAFSEAKNYIGPWSDSSSGASIEYIGWDGWLNATIGPNMTFTVPDKELRGGFRYLTVFILTNSTASVTISDISVEMSFQPTWSNFRAYQGYFHSNDQLLNRIWYAGAWTVQSNMVPVNTGRAIPVVSYGWANNDTLGPGNTIVVDGAKRDRAVWPGDMGVAVPTSFVSVGELDSIMNALQVMYNYQMSNGGFYEAGPPLLQTGSDTYHMWTMIGTYNYVLYTDDTAFLEQNWAGYQRAMTFILDKVDNSSLLNVTGIRDWARWQQGFHNTEANMILYRTLKTGSKIATWAGNDSLAANWTSRATTLRSAINARTFDTSVGAFKDNDTATTLYPQDANSMSLLFNVPNITSRYSSIATQLTDNWSPIGPVSPELPHNISPFISSFELQGRLNVRDTTRAMELLRTTWGWIINNENSTGSTLIEGYLANGSFSYRSDRGYAYDPTYTSHSHGWSSGPTSALTNYILGLDVTEPAGRAWSLSPQWADLTDVEGGFTTPLGAFSAKWSKVGASTYTISWSTPSGTSGTVMLPARARKISVNGKTVNAASKGVTKTTSGLGVVLFRVC